MYFLKLVRPINLVIIALTMYSVRFFYFVLGGAHSSNGNEGFDFFLLVFSTVLIAAGGNIINDYFDVRADRINRPDRLIITKHIKRRWAIISHWILNLLAFSIAVYLSARYHTFWYVFIHLLTINSLWFYSMYFKRKPFIGNMLIAILTALVPILCGIHFYLQIEFPGGHHEIIPVHSLHESISVWKDFLLSKGRFVYVLAYFAFTLNLSREIIKDVQDMEGDKLIYAKTLPLVIGVKKSLWIATLILMLAPICFTSLFLISVTQSYIFNLIALLPLALSSILNFISVFFLLKKNISNRTLKRADFVIKIAMLAGILIPFYWWLLI